MAGLKLYAAAERSLNAQAVRTTAELRARPELTRAAYAPLGLDALGFADTLEATWRRWRVALHLRRRCTARADALRARRSARILGDAVRWLRRLRTRVEGARRDGVEDVDDLRRLLRRARPDRAAHTARTLRDAVRQQARLREVLPGAAALVDEGVALSREVEALTLELGEALRARKASVRRCAKEKEALVASFRRLDLWADEAVAAGVEVVPGRGREVLAHWAATRPALRRGPTEAPPEAPPTAAQPARPTRRVARFRGRRWSARGGWPSAR